MNATLWQQLIVVSIPAILSLLGAGFAGRFAFRAKQAELEAARLRDLEQRVAEKKAELYDPVITLLGDLLTPERSDKAKKRMGDVMADFQPLVTLWGSDEVNEAFFRFRASASADPPPKVTMRLVADFLLAVRRDVAWPDSEIDGLHTVGSRINDLHKDIETVMALTKPLDEVFEMTGWHPQYPMRSMGKLRAPGEKDRRRFSRRWS